MVIVHDLDITNPGSPLFNSGPLAIQPYNYSLGPTTPDYWGVLNGPGASASVGAASLRFLAEPGPYGRFGLVWPWRTPWPPPANVWAVLAQAWWGQYAAIQSPSNGLLQTDPAGVLGASRLRVDFQASWQVDAFGFNWGPWATNLWRVGLWSPVWTQVTQGTVGFTENASVTYGGGQPVRPPLLYQRISALPSLTRWQLSNLRQPAGGAPGSIINVSGFYQFTADNLLPTAEIWFDLGPEESGMMLGSVIPEPSTSLLLACGLGVGALGRFWRRRRRAA